MLEIAGQRVQIIKPDAKKGGRLEFGTEIVRSSDGSLAALLGASPGASTAVSIMLELIRKGTPVLSAAQGSIESLRTLVPGYGISLSSDPATFDAMHQRTQSLLQLG